MHMEEHQPESACTGCGGLGIDDFTSIEGVEPSSFAATGDRSLVHLYSSCGCMGGLSVLQGQRQGRVCSGRH